MTYQNIPISLQRNTLMGTRSFSEVCCVILTCVGSHILKDKEPYHFAITESKILLIFHIFKIATVDELQ